MNLDAIPRPDVDAGCYRKLEALAMQLTLQLPHDDVGKCLIVRDIFENVLKRWAADERMAQHQPAKAIADEINRGSVIRLISGD